jgi:16S rRNA (cytosine967-C5)-methyltransferase
VSPTPTAPTARQIAATVLVRVEKDSAFAAAVLDAELARAPQLESRDRAFATELVYGCLRVRPWLDAQIARHATRGIDRTDPRTRAEIALAAYQLFFSRVPAFAAVNEAVESVRRARGVTVSRFANAILRKLSREADGKKDDLGAEAAWASTPEWLRSALCRALGEPGARAFIESGASAPPLCLRVEREAERAAWIERLRAAAPGKSFEPGKVSPLGILVRGAGDVRALPGFAEGAFSIQEEGSQVVALALGARPGDSVLDACAGRGNKSAVLARAVREGGALDAADSQPEKLERLVRELARLGLAARNTYAVDWSVGAGDCTLTYDRVLVDAPCSGTGTIRRRPELLTRRQPEDLARLAALQEAILTRAADRVRPGGRLLYAVCSVLREEAEQVLENVLTSVPALELVPFDGAGAATLTGSGQTTLRLLPHVHGTDGYFLASLRKKE